MITNLISNAIRYNTDVGRIDIRTESSRDQTVIQISDTGPGIPPEHLPHIFDRFYRADPSRSR